jgi:hypothetical protein
VRVDVVVLVDLVAAAGRAQRQVERHFAMMEVETVDGKVAGALFPKDIAELRAAVGRIQLGGVGHQVRTVLRLRGHRPTHVSACRFPVPCLGGFVLVARQNR